eukprot:8014934-Pyramimonas_sp.AAC.1
MAMFEVKAFWEYSLRGAFRVILQVCVVSLDGVLPAPRHIFDWSREGRGAGDALRQRGPAQGSG